ncbi:hypothetical protein DRQ32_03600 [bacterium]|nr:MAG: hypothetical protein DRQ32_03600 [bacterium]
MTRHADPIALAVQTRIWREKSPGEKILLTARLWMQARALKLAVVRQRHPEWDAARVEAAVREAMHGGRA